MENREAFTGISVEAEESVEEVNWRHYNYNQRRRGNNRGNYRGNYHQTSYNSQGRGYKNNYNDGYGKSGQQTVITVQYIRQVTPQMFNAYYVD